MSPNELKKHRRRTKKWIKRPILSLIAHGSFCELHSCLVPCQNFQSSPSEFVPGRPIACGSESLPWLIIDTRVFHKASLQKLVHLRAHLLDFLRCTPLASQDVQTEGNAQEKEDHNGADHCFSALQPHNAVAQLKHAGLQRVAGRERVVNVRVRLQATPQYWPTS